MLNTTQYNTSDCECGIPLTFDIIKPISLKLGEIIGASASNLVATLTTRTNHTIQSGENVEILSNNNSINTSFLGQHIITKRTDTTISYNLRHSDIPIATVAALV